MLSKYLLFVAIILQISYILSAPVNDGTIKTERNRKRPAWTLNRPPLSLFKLNLAQPLEFDVAHHLKFLVPHQSKWSFRPFSDLNGFRGNPQYQFNDKFKFGPFMGYNRGNKVADSGFRAEYTAKKSVNKDVNQQDFSLIASDEQAAVDMNANY